MCRQRWYWFGHRTRVQSVDAADELMYNDSDYEVTHRAGAVVGIKIRDLTKVSA